ncbi:hypothetical protein [Edaphobacter modestus]|uniref:Outer membrane protein with beta-barrel domain n=1 Tax=Edaphobacter modestus TaxID=388466 RepID=A0A4Q7YT44_9BACT|nr:hypothetical protein [Edaphobacter modestus]RZU40748.1 hypothetical protein BDD14_2223 [Edaphobacter modestus]
MKTTRQFRLVVLGAAFFAGSAAAQIAPANPAEKSSGSPSNEWSFSLGALGYLVPNDLSYGSPIFNADHKWLQTALDVQRGVSLGFAYRKMDYTTYIFNAGWADPTMVIALTYKF